MAMDTRLLAEAREALLWTNYRLALVIPSMLATGERFSLRVTGLGPDGLPSGALDRPIELGASEGVEGLPATVRLDGTGQAVVEGLRAVGPSRAIVRARPEGCPGVVTSNPAWVADEPPYRLFWGDLHVHTTYSNCSPWACKSPEFAYAYARDVTGLDFAAAADHLRGIAAQSGRWDALCATVMQYDQPGRFVPLLAFESSHKTGFGGDINAYYRTAQAPHFWLDRDDMRTNNPAVTLRQLWDFLDATGEDYLTIPHHTGRADKHRAFDEGEHDPRCEPLFEVYSWWGSSERRASRFPLCGGNSDRPSYLQDALRAGCRYGLIASSDDHRTMPGGEAQASLPAGPARLANYIHHGLAAVRADDLTRDALWRGLTRRRCYATTHARTLLEVSLGELEMGQSAPIGPADGLRKARRIIVRVLPANANRLEVTLVRNGLDLQSQHWRPEMDTLTFEDAEPLDAVALREARYHPEPFVVYYVRVEDRFSQTQWSSPIWLDLT